MIYEFVVGSSGCCRVLGSAMCSESSDSLIVIFFSDDGFSLMGLLQWWLILSFNVADGSSLKIYEMWSLEEERRL